MRKPNTGTPQGRLTFREALARTEATSLDFLPAQLNEFRYEGDTSFSIDGCVLEFSPPAWNAACGRFAYPSNLLPQLGPGLGKLTFRVTQAKGRRAPKVSERVRLALCQETGRVLALTDDRLAALPNSDVVKAMMEAWPSAISSETIEVARFELTPTEFSLDCHTDRLRAEPRKGDVLHGGISIRHSQAGTCSTTILSYISRLACSNGMTQRICLQNRAARIRRCSSENSPDYMIASIKRQVKGAWAQLQERLEAEMAELLDHRIDIRGLPEDLRRRWSINRTVARNITRALDEDELGPTGTELDLVNALSRVATHSCELQPRYRRHLSLAAGMYAQRHIHRCPLCGSWFAEEEGSGRLGQEPGEVMDPAGCSAN